MIDEAFKNKYEVGSETSYNESGDSAKNLFGLSYSHAYVVLGTDQLYDKEGNLEYNLIRIRNPWRAESYSGPWSDEDERWTDFY